MPPTHSECILYSSCLVKGCACTPHCARWQGSVCFGGMLARTVTCGMLSCWPRTLNTLRFIIYLLFADHHPRHERLPASPSRDSGVQTELSPEGCCCSHFHCNTAQHLSLKLELHVHMDLEKLSRSLKDEPCVVVLGRR